MEEGGVDLSSIVAGTDGGPDANPQAFSSPDTAQTREIYAGAFRNHYSDVPYIFNENYYSLELGESGDFEDPGEHPNHFIVLQGEWTKGPESIKHARTTTGLEDSIFLQFNGTSANVVIDNPDGMPFEVYIDQDGFPIPKEAQGDDIKVDGIGRTYILVDEPRMYRLVLSEEYGGHDLKLSSNSDLFSIFAFTFGSYGSIA